MKRDFDLIRNLLHIVEEAGSQPQGMVHTHGIRVADPRVQYHLRLLVDAGYVRGFCQTMDGRVCVRLTWQGHELLELTRNEAVWERAKRLVQRQTHAMSITSLHAVLTQWATEVVASTDKDNWMTDSRQPSYDQCFLPVSLPATRRFVPPPTVDPPGSNRAAARTANHETPQDGSHDANGNNGSFERDSAESSFQFHVWSGEIETLPLYLL